MTTVPRTASHCRCRAGAVASLLEHIHWRVRPLFCVHLRLEGSRQRMAAAANTVHTVGAKVSVMVSKKPRWPTLWLRRSQRGCCCGVEIAVMRVSSEAAATRVAANAPVKRPWPGKCGCGGPPLRARRSRTNSERTSWYFRATARYSCPSPALECPERAAAAAVVRAEEAVKGRAPMEDEAEAAARRRDKQVWRRQYRQGGGDG